MSTLEKSSVLRERIKRIKERDELEGFTVVGRREEDGVQIITYKINSTGETEEVRFDGSDEIRQKIEENSSPYNANKKLSQKDVIRLLSIRFNATNKR
jgi:hypothetical protein